MELNYQCYSFEVVFRKKVLFDIFPPFIFRSVLGMELKKLACILRKNKCENCELKFQCVYSKIFESPLPENSEILKGRNYASHPFVMTTDISEGSKTDKIVLKITLIGEAVQYIPYIYIALKKAGENGIFKNRIPFLIKDVTVDDDSILLSEEKLKIPNENKKWILNKDYSGKIKENILLNFKSPIRIKIGGKYRSEFSYTEFLHSVFRRAGVLSGLYGKNSPSIDEIPDEIKKKWDMNFVWKDLTRYSARQKSVMKLGGVTGTAEVSGNFSPFEMSLIDFAEIFHVGKNPSFGLGKVKVFKKK